MTMRAFSAVFGSHFDHSTCSGPFAIKSHVTPFRSRPMPLCGPHRMWEQHHATTGPSGSQIVSVRKTLGAPHPIDFLLHTPGGNDLIGSRVNLKEKLQLMWQHNPPVTKFWWGFPLTAPNFGNALLHTLRSASWAAVCHWVHGCYSGARRPPKFFATWPTKKI